MDLIKYEIIIHRKDCIKCGNCYSLDSKHFEPDIDYTSMVVNGETTAEISKCVFEDNDISLVEQAAEECPAEIILIKRLTK